MVRPRARRSTASRTWGTGSTYGMRMKRSKVPSTPNLGPGAIRRSSSAAARARAVATGASSSIQRHRPPDGTVKRHCGNSARSAATSASRWARRSRRRAAMISSDACSRCTAINCSSTGDAMSTFTRSAASRAKVGAAARVQPMRSPPQNGLLMPPIDTVRAPRS
ncbi:hypothetical protein GCM10009558_020090 [Virgisporangium aurantiacum]